VSAVKDQDQPTTTEQREPTEQTMWAPGAEAGARDMDETAVLPRQVDAPVTAERPAGGHAAAETVVIPKQTAPIAEAAPKVDAWDADPAARGVAPVEGSPFGRARALGTVAWIFSGVITAALALIRLNWASMRTQELAAWGFTNTPWRLIPRLVRDTNAGDVPYFVALKAWAAVFGRSDFALRVPSVILMAATVALLSVLATRLVGPRTGALVGLLMAVMPITSRYAQEAGPQALTLFGAVLSTLALVALFDRPRASRVVGYAAAVALMGLGHVTGLVVLVAHLLTVLLMKRAATLRWLLGALIGAAPTVALLVATGARPWRTTGTTVPAADLPSLTQLAQDAFGAVIVGGVLVGFGLLALSGRKPGAVFTIWAVVPLVLLYPVAHFTTFDASQLALLAVPGWIGLCGLGLSRVPVVRGVFGVLVVAAIGLPTHFDVRQSDGHGQASHQLADLLFQQDKPGDAIVYGPADGDGAAGRDVVARYLSAAHRPKDILALATPRADGHLATPECVDVDKCLGKTDRIWLVRVGSYDEPLSGLEAGKDGALRVRYTVAQSWQLTGLSLTLYTLKPNA
jgi:mannosyltransferase